jgi:hypothetical protein
MTFIDFFCSTAYVSYTVLYFAICFLFMMSQIFTVFSLLLSVTESDVKRVTFERKISVQAVKVKHRKCTKRILMLNFGGFALFGVSAEWLRPAAHKVTLF